MMLVVLCSQFPFNPRELSEEISLRKGEQENLGVEWSGTENGARRGYRATQKIPTPAPDPPCLEVRYTHPALPGAWHWPHLLQLPEELDWAGTLKQRPVEEGNSTAMDSQ